MATRPRTKTRRSASQIIPLPSRRPHLTRSAPLTWFLVVPARWCFLEMSSSYQAARPNFFEGWHRFFRALHSQIPPMGSHARHSTTSVERLSTILVDYFLRHRAERLFRASPRKSFSPVGFAKAQPPRHAGASASAAEAALRTSAVASALRMESVGIVHGVDQQAADPDELSEDAEGLVAEQKTVSLSLPERDTSCSPPFARA